MVWSLWYEAAILFNNWCPSLFKVLFFLNTVWDNKLFLAKLTLNTAH